MRYDFNTVRVEQSQEDIDAFAAQERERRRERKIKLAKERLAQAKKGDLSFLSKMRIVPGKDWKFSPITGEPHTWVGYLQKKVKDLEVER